VALEQDASAHADLAVLSEPLALDQILGNIIGNAVKFTAPGSTVEVRVERRGTGVAIVVSDRGPGLAADLRDRIFEPFSRGDSAEVRAAEGAGLGLSIVHALVRRHGGGIDMDDRPGGGLVATLVLPGA
jgi:signal transduction histidine kinase